MIGQTFGNMRNKVCLELLQNQNIVKALVVEDENFLDTVLNEQQQEYIDDPSLLMRKYVYPYKKTFDTAMEHKTIISIAFSNFNKQGKNYRNGLVTFYVLCPVNIEKTAYGVRYDYIADEIENVFTKTTIGEFNFHNRGDIEVGDRYIGHYVTLKITEFHIV